MNHLVIYDWQDSELHVTITKDNRIVEFTFPYKWDEADWIQFALSEIESLHRFRFQCLMVRRANKILEKLT